MKEYHLSYDVTDADLYEPTKVKEHIVAHLYAKDVLGIESPVGSTLVFKDTSTRDVDDWITILQTELNTDLRNIIYFDISSTEIIGATIQSTSYTEKDALGKKSTKFEEFQSLLKRVRDNLPEKLHTNYPNR
ncbi:MAG: hypothetical protein WC756_15535 [Taibaiella sp.]|jgi:hypothetical protein